MVRYGITSTLKSYYQSLILNVMIEIMMPHVHILIGLIGANIFMFTGVDHTYSMWFILGSVLPDIDFSINIILKKNSHRELPTHFPLIYFFGAFILGIFGLFPLLFLFFAGLIHTILDTIDWEIYLLAPLSKRSFTILRLDYKEISKKGDIFSFLKRYYQKRQIIVIELLIFILWIISCFLNYY